MFIPVFSLGCMFVFFSYVPAFICPMCVVLCCIALCVLCAMGLVAWNKEDDDNHARVRWQSYVFVDGLDGGLTTTPYTHDNHYDDEETDKDDEEGDKKSPVQPRRWRHGHGCRRRILRQSAIDPLHVHPNLPSQPATLIL